VDEHDQVRPGRSVFADSDDEGDFFLDEEPSADLPHWTDPPTQRTRVVPPAQDANWGTYTETPKWRDEVDGDDDDDVEFAFEEQPARATGVGPAVEDFFGFDEDGDQFRSRDLDALGPKDPIILEDIDEAAPIVPVGESRRARPARRAAPEQAAAPVRDDMTMRVVTGAVMAVVAVVALAVGAAATVALVAVVLGMAAAEFFSATRKEGYQPATLLGIVAAAAMPLAVYNRGFEAIPIVMTLTVIFSLLWFLLGAGTESAVLNIGVTVFGVAYIGGLGGFAGLLLKAPNGVGLMIAAAVPVIAYDIGGLLVGRAMGRSPLSASSPNKTVEGLLGGCIAAVLAATIVVGAFSIAPFGDNPGSLAKAFVLGLGIAVVAPLGDLSESMLKRDLNIKDMGGILPGHGGLLDRFDGLLFALPTTWYLAQLLLW
jgi:phosphatidate cytidylyltransferase